MCELNELEKNLHPLEIFQIRDADSSQQQAMLAVKNGSNLLIEGPPGTGKSQTIANIIAESLAANKKVLFVSQKMAALEVVKKRLDGAGLGDFCMELHSRKTDKKEVVKELARIAELERRPDHDHDEDLAKLEDVRDKLNAYIKDLHMPYGALGMTPYQAFGIVSSHSDVSGLNYIFRDITSWDRKKYNKCCDLLGSLSHNLASVYHPDQHPWNGSTLTDLSYEEKLELQATMQKVLDEISSLLGYLNKLANQIAFVEPKTLMETQPMLDAAALMANSPKAPAAILKNEKWNSLGRDISEIIDAVKAFNKFSEDITGKYDKKVISLDVEALLTRYKKYATSGFFFLIPSFWSDKKLVSEIIITGHKPKFKDCWENR
jgi:DNA polymerase III delta prime subunit